MKTIEIIGGGTVYHIRNHLSLAATAYGSTARFINELAKSYSHGMKVNCHLTKMANQGQGNLETNEDISNLVDKLIKNNDTKIIFFNPALADFKAKLDDESNSGKYESRLKTSDGDRKLILSPNDKVISKIRKSRKDIFLVGFKTTCGATEDEQFIAGLNLLKNSSCNLVLANDSKTRVNMIITPEQARYFVSKNRNKVLSNLFMMALDRSSCNFTRSTVLQGNPIDWNSDQVPTTLRNVVNFCINKGAYKPFNGVTVGHFAAKIDDKTFLTSRRKTNFNNLDSVGLVKVESSDKNNVIAFGSKPSVGGQSQRIIFSNHPEMDCIVHFHLKMKGGALLPVKSQKPYECGSHECGENTSNGLLEVEPGIKCVYLDKHGPNIVFNQNIDSDKVIKFIESNFDFKASTDDLLRE